ncbi:LPD29 domain-containing protein [Streptomyces decoyicus]|uniref:LPD29 domain-containing protein n=1 Tax=Streptomyces decoyicus TaxID=249567 RepID=UPI0036601EED
MITNTAEVAYLALRLPVGTRVVYHGTDAASHGEWTVQPCACRRCAGAAWLGRPARRYELYTADGRPGPLVHVRHTSVTPVPGEEELNEANCAIPTKYAAVHLRKELRRTFPSVKFTVRTGQGKHRQKISVSWTGGPGRTQVSAVVAPLLAQFGPGSRRKPRRISVTVAGRVHSGMPLVEAITLDRN